VNDRQHHFKTGSPHIDCEVFARGMAEVLKTTMVLGMAESRLDIAGEDEIERRYRERRSVNPLAIRCGCRELKIHLQITGNYRGCRYRDLIFDKDRFKLINLLRELLSVHFVKWPLRDRGDRMAIEVRFLSSRLSPWIHLFPWRRR
jgi:hypothetical protein